MHNYECTKQNSLNNLNNDMILVQSSVGRYPQVHFIL